MSAEIVVMEDCGSNYGVFTVKGSAGNDYIVTLNGSEGPASCTCPSFLYSGAEQTCKHIRELWEGGACLYNPQWKEGTPNPKYRPFSYTYRAFTGNSCPVCGENMVAVRRAI